MHEPEPDPGLLPSAGVPIEIEAARDYHQLKSRHVAGKIADGTPNAASRGPQYH